jgi:hypothetical protein
MRYFLYGVLFCFFITGCSGDFGCSKVKQTIGWKSEDLSPEDRQKQADEEKRKREEAQQRLKDADTLVHSFTERNGQPDSGGGFKHFEGLTDADPWGNQLKVIYHQDGTNEIMTVRSAGPDGVFDNSDDLVRTRTASNFWGFHKGLTFWQWVGLVWAGSAILGTILYVFVGARRTKNRKHPLGGFVLLLIFGPIALVMYAIVTLFSIFGVVDFDFDLGDFDFPDFDLF